MSVEPDKLRERAAALHEFNPMLGHRGCRLAISYPGDRRDAGARHLRGGARGRREDRQAGPPRDHGAARRDQGRVRPRRRARSPRPPRRSPPSKGKRPDYTVGTMIELPRAALHADKIAEGADFFSFGTNDLTQTTFGLSRDDAASLPRRLHGERHPRHRPVRHARHRGRRRADPDRRRPRSRDPPRHQARHLRRAWRRPGDDRLLRGDRPRLRLLLALPRADRPPCGGAGLAPFSRTARRTGHGVRDAPRSAATGINSVARLIAHQ